MLKLIRIEWHKIKPYTLFWLFTGLYAFILFGAYMGVRKATSTEEFPLGFPMSWQGLTYIAGWLNPFLVLLTILYSTNEYSFNTFRQNVIDGLSRSELFISKLWVHLFFSAYSTILVLLLGTLFSALFSKAFTVENYFHDMHFLAIHFLKCITIFSIAFFISLLFKKGIVSIIILIILYIIDALISWIVTYTAADMLPFASMSNLINNPLLEQFAQQMQVEAPIPLWYYIVAVVAYLILFNVGSWYLLQKRDLKG